MRRATGVLAALIGVTVAGAAAEDVPFKLGTFETGGRTFVGLVRSDNAVVDIAAANAVLEKSHAAWPKLRPPADMKDLIARYETGGLKARLHAMASEPATGPFVHALKAIKVRPPIVYPETMLNAAVNYTEHDTEMAGRTAAPAPAAPANPPRSAPGLWVRRPDDTRQNPYLFLKPRTAVIADGETIRIPPGRDQADWECELLLVIGRWGSHVPLARAADYVFGYSLENDVSDRGGRGDSRFGSDWLVGKAHDTYAPQGPFIVPKEFVKDPQKLGIKFSLSGKLMQDSNTDRMTHNVYELLHFASNILTLQPGDVISTGSPAGVGSARNPPIYMKPGDVATCTIEGIGTLTNPVAAAGEGWIRPEPRPLSPQ
jgi:2-keto-4-pentenoate hydratase/2-oxohepta-3-ene-1,7-dioic acid hydratase in catechol pathway